VHEARPAAAAGDAGDSDYVAVAFAPVVGQRILADEAVGQVNIEMRARLERRKLAAAESAQLEAHDIERLRADIGDLHRERPGG
jgi:hypothetical protein